MAAKAKFKRCERDFEIQGMAFLTGNGLKTGNTPESNSEEQCPNCGYIATHETKEILWET